MKALTIDSVMVTLTLPGGKTVELKPCLEPLEFSTKHIAEFVENYKRHNKAMERMDSLVGIIPPERKWIK